MSIEILLEGKLEKEKDSEVFSAYLKDLCDEKRIKMEDYDTMVTLDICPEGFIECSYEGLFVSVVAQTNVAGPGFHAFVCQLFDEILADSGIEWEISDPTGYFEKRNFEDLKYTYFYRWLEDIAGYVTEHHKDHNDLCISWPLDYYQPAEKTNMVVTPMGYISVDDFKHHEIEELAERFFIWNEKEYNAKYYRNCALTLLWKECYFSYSAMNEATDKTANSIMDYIEAAFDKDDSLPLPMNAYRVIANAIERECVIKDGISMSDETIGYRKHIVAYQYGNWKIPADGCSEKSFDKSTGSLHFMAPYNDAKTPWEWMMNISAYTFDQVQESFLEMLINPASDAIEAFDLHLEKVEGKAVVHKVEDYIIMTVQLNADKDTILLEYIVNNIEDIEKMKTWCYGIKHQTFAEDEETKS